jgi:hypothetical protein
MAEELLEELRRCGVQVEARDEVLHVEAPRGALSQELVQSLRKLKPEDAAVTFAAATRLSTCTPGPAAVAGRTPTGEDS